MTLFVASLDEEVFKFSTVNLTLPHLTCNKSNVRIFPHHHFHADIRPLSDKVAEYYYLRVYHRLSES